MFAYIIRSICEPDVGMDGTKNRRGRIRLLAPPTMLLSKEYDGFVKGRGMLEMNQFHEFS